MTWPEGQPQTSGTQPQTSGNQPQTSGNQPQTSGTQPQTSISGGINGMEQPNEGQTPSGQQPPSTSADGMVTEAARRAAQRQRAAQRARDRRANWSEERRQQEKDRNRDRARERRARARESRQQQGQASAQQGDGGGAQESNPTSAARDTQTAPYASITGVIPAG